tara:strand:- start:4362 stop:4478 length:117 start_codon:yes stop_codon:yes gene_type:complete
MSDSKKKSKNKPYQGKRNKTKAVRLLVRREKQKAKKNA